MFTLSWIKKIAVGFSVGIVAMPSVVYAALPNDPQLFQSGGVESLQLSEAWNITQGSPAVVVAVIDAGVSIDNPDLTSNIWTNTAEQLDGIDNDGNGLVDDIHGWNFVQNNNDVRPVYSNTDAPNKIGLNHGTVISGIIGAVGNNGVGGAGVNWRVRILPLKILDEKGDGDTELAVKAIDYAIQKKVNIINLSFVGPTPSLDFIQAVRRAYRAGILVVAAAGNASEGNTGLNLNVSPQYPVCFDDPLKEENWVIGVAALQTDGKIAPFSNYGDKCIDISAPGARIPSTIFVDPTKPGDIYGGAWSGTSMAAPFVSGVAALIKSVQPTWGPDQIRKALLENIDPVPGNTARDAGRGSLNAYKAVKYALQGGDGGVPVGFYVAPIKSGQTVYADIYDTDLNRVKTVTLGKGVFGSGALVTADIDGVGVGQIITAVPDARGTIVRIMQRDGKLIREFRPFGNKEKKDVVISAVDTNNDGSDELVITSNTLRQILVVSGTGKEISTIRVPEKTGKIFVSAAREPDKAVIVAGVQNGKRVNVYVWDAIGAFISTFTADFPVATAVELKTVLLQDGQSIIKLFQQNGNTVFSRTFSKLGLLENEFLAKPTTGRLLGFALGRLAQTNSDKAHLVMAVAQGSTLVFEAVDSEGKVFLSMKNTKVRPQYFNFFFGK